jgi:hypothetical protein
MGRRERRMNVCFYVPLVCSELLSPLSHFSPSHSLFFVSPGQKFYKIKTKFLHSEKEKYGNSSPKATGYLLTGIDEIE